MPREADPQADAKHNLGRVQSRKLEKWRATQRLAGSSVLGAVAAWKILTYEAPPGDGIPLLLVVWLGLALLSFGLASWDQVANVIKR